MAKFFSNKVLLVLIIILNVYYLQAKKHKSSSLIEVNDNKEFKKLLRTKTNVLVLYLVEPKFSQNIVQVFRETAEIVKGQATMILIDCNLSDGKKLCKKIKVSPEKAYCIKHYKDGEYHKDYDRNESVLSIVNFLRDPTGELPWEEDPESTEITHLPDGEAIIKFLKRGPATFKKSMIMFYAPWCGYCKTLKPEYVQAAADLKGEAILGAIDVARPGNSRIRQQYNISGFPTLHYYERGQFRFPYNGDNKREAIVEFIRDPLSQFRRKEKAEPADEGWPKDDTEVVHLTVDNFDQTLTQSDNALIVFYAPWCGHCKKIKPEYIKAAASLKKQGLKGILGAVDATQEPGLAERFGVTGYPTLKYFYKGEYKFDASHARDEKQILQFMKDPQEPPPPPPPERPWAEEESHVRHLDGSSFRPTLRKIKHALIMFYAPWCGHCKNAKPEIVKAAQQFADELMVAFGAVDCTVEQALCTSYGVRGYPTIKYFSYYDKLVKDYSGGRKEADFVAYIHNHMGTLQDSQKDLKAKNQAAGYGVNVLLLSDDDFEKVIAQPTPTFVMFFASWCGHCSDVKPAYSKLASQFKSENSPIKVTAVDAAENQKVADLANINALPAFKLYTAGKLVTNYEGERSFESWLEFLKSSATASQPQKQEL